MMLGQTTHFNNKPDSNFYLDLNLYASNKAKNPWAGAWNGTAPNIVTNDKKFGRACCYPSTTYRYDLTSAVNPNGIVIICWFKTEIITSPRGLFSLLVADSTTRIQCQVNADNNMSVGIVKNGSSILDAVVYQQCIYNAWTQFTCIISDKVYYGQNGNLVYRSFTSPIDFSINQIIIGNYQYNNTYIWPGYIDCFQIWRKSLIVPKRSSIQTREI